MRFLLMDIVPLKDNSGITNIQKNDQSKKKTAGKNADEFYKKEEQQDLPEGGDKKLEEMLYHKENVDIEKYQNKIPAKGDAIAFQNKKYPGIIVGEYKEVVITPERFSVDAKYDSTGFKLKGLKQAADILKDYYELDAKVSNLRKSGEKITKKELDNYLFLNQYKTMLVKFRPDLVKMIVSDKKFDALDEKYQKMVEPAREYLKNNKKAMEQIKKELAVLNKKENKPIKGNLSEGTKTPRHLKIKPSDLRWSR